MSAQITETGGYALRMALSQYVRAYVIAVLKLRADSRGHNASHGLNNEFVDQIKRLGVLEFEEFVHYATTRMIRRHGFPKFCLETLGATGESLSHQSAERALINDFVSVGASQEIMQQLFGLRRAELANLRSDMKLDLASGRPKKASTSERDAIIQVWQSHPEELDERFKLYLTHLDTQLSINTVWQVLQRGLKKPN